jgi:O-acetyl-ADP-ribose deacetylase (regulator of RNase III)
VEVAGGLGATSLAFPAISTGVYGYPRAEAARIAVSTLGSVAAPAGLSVARLIAFDEETLSLYEALL